MLDKQAAELASADPKTLSEPVDAIFVEPLLRDKT